MPIHDPCAPRPPSPDRRTWRLPFPRYVIFQTTSRCNSACAFCPSHHLRNRLAQGDMDQALFAKIVQECSLHPEVERIMPYLMNEPLLDSRLLDRVNHIKDANPWATVHFLTNGTLLTPQRTEEILASRLDWIGISVPALRAETYNRITGRTDGEEKLRQIEAFVGRALKVKHPNYVMISITRWERELARQEEEDAVAFWRDRGVVRLERYQGPISRAGNATAVTGVTHDSVAGCREPWTPVMIHILFDGSVVLCCMDWRRQVVLGNARQQSIEEIWQGAGRAQVMDEVCGLAPARPGFLCLKCEHAVPAQNAGAFHSRLSAESLQAPTKAATCPSGISQAVLSFKMGLWNARALHALALSRPERLLGGNGYFRGLELPLVAELLDVRPGLRVLEAGSGDSILPITLAREGAEVMVLDNESLCGGAMAFQRAARRGAGPGSLAVIRGDARRMPFGDQAFHRISALSMIEHIPGNGDSLVMAEIGRVLAPGGRAVLSFPIGWAGFSERADRPGVGYLERHYDRQAIIRRLVIPSHLSLVKVVYFGERDIRAGQIWNRSPQAARRLAGALTTALGSLLWRVLGVAEDLEGFGQDPRLARAGVVALVLTKRSQPS